MLANSAKCKARTSREERIARIAAIRSIAAKATQRLLARLTTLQHAVLVVDAKCTPVGRKECKEQQILATRALSLIDTSSKATDPTIADPAIPDHPTPTRTFKGERKWLR